MFRQKPGEITKGANRHLGIAEGQHRAGSRIQHPRRHDNAGAALALDKNNISPAAPLTVE